MTLWSAQSDQVSTWCELEGARAEGNSKSRVPGALVKGYGILIISIQI